MFREKLKKFIISIVLVLLGVALANLYPSTSNQSPTAPNLEHKNQSQQIKWWTCSMHPQIKLPNPGSCPLCGMDLIPMEDDDDQSGDWEISLGKRARTLAEIETFTVARRPIEIPVRMVGRIEADESKLAIISARFPGRLEKLFVNYTGINVKKGEHMAVIYSPELLAAQEELLQTKRALSSSAQSGRAEKLLQSSYQATRKKLSLWGLSEADIDAIITRGKVSDTITITAPIGGVVLHKNAMEGAYVKTGSGIYTIADLSTVWVVLEAYERDLNLLSYGAKVEIVTETFGADKPLTGRISFIDPVVNQKTRTTKVRVTMDNQAGLLKPGMFVQGRALVQVGSRGQQINEFMQGKYVGPMHPEIIRDAPGKCDICGMELVLATESGLLKATESILPMVIPVSAPLITGRRAVVYVERETGVYVGHEVVLGMRSPDYYIVKSGLKVGQKVVVRGSFKIDSALQIKAKKSMMSLPPERKARAVSTAHKDPEENTIKYYLLLQKALAGDNFEELIKIATKAQSEVTAANYHRHLKTLASTLSIGTARKAFFEFSQDLTQDIARSPNDFSQLYRFNCPMYEGGADWLQNTPELKNPYYGPAMLTCGSSLDLKDSGHGNK